MEIFNKVKEVCSEYSSCQTLSLNIGRTLSKIKKFKEALIYVDKVLEFNVNDAEALGVKSGILFEDGKEEEALNIAKKALEINPKDPTVLYNQACMFSRLNKIDEAIEPLRKAIELEPSIKGEMEKDSDFDGIRKNERFAKEFG